MFALTMILLLMWVALSVLFFAIVLFLQGYFNETPPDVKQVLWRAPTASTTLMLFVVLWCLLAYNAPDRFPAFTEYSATHRTDHAKEMWVVQGGKKTHYEMQNTGGKVIYRNRDIGVLKAKPAPEEIIIKEEGQEVVFKAERDKEGKFKIEPGQDLRYRDEKGRYMEAGYLGEVWTVKTGQGFLYFFLMAVHLALWFGCMWPILSFSWGRALVLAVASWAAMTLLIMPPLLTRVVGLSKQNEKQTQERRELHKESRAALQRN